MPGARGKSRREERTRRCSICLGERFGIVAWDEFAATLLMPLDDSRRQITPKGQPNFDELSACATRYNVSLAAVILRWPRYMDRRAMIVVSRDGFMKWAWSSEPAFRGSPSRRWRKRLGESVRRVNTVRQRPVTIVRLRRGAKQASSPTASIWIACSRAASLRCRPRLSRRANCRALRFKFGALLNSGY
jgi:hypothetical protein